MALIGIIGLGALIGSNGLFDLVFQLIYILLGVWRTIKIQFQKRCCRLVMN